MPYLELQDLAAGYEKNVPVLEGFNLTVAKGELVSLLGPSGCGKTTTLRTVAGFIEPTGGRVIINGRDYTRTPPNRRNIGLVFQSYALFPHLSVYENVAFGLRMRRVRPADINQRVSGALQMVDLAGYEKRLPSQMSGGQRQRVALARAVVIEPDLLLLDEPLSNLDAKLRVGMRAELHRLQRQLGITTIYVTHDQVEAMSLSDRVVVMNRGKIEQEGKPEEIYYRPATPFVARFMGFDNQFVAHITGSAGDQLQIEANGISLIARPHFVPDLRGAQQVDILFRPESAALQHQAGPNAVPGEVIFRTFQGSAGEYLVRTGLGEFNVSITESQPSYVPGPIYLYLPPDKIVVERHA